MTEAEKPRMQVYDLPLFPLNTVLFPGMPLNLHIFEERYKQMMRTCMDADQVFGVVLIRKGREALGPLAEPYPIGCTARISKVEPLNEGRMNVLAIGQQRFRTLSLDAHSAPYLVGTVKTYPFTESDRDAVQEARDSLVPWLRRYLEALSQASDSNLDLQEIPEDPETLACLAAIALQVPQKDKQRLLSIAGSLELLDQLHDLFKKEISLLEVIASKGRGKSIGHFSVN